MVLNVHSIRLIRDGEKGVWRWGKRMRLRIKFSLSQKKKKKKKEKKRSFKLTPPHWQPYAIFGEFISISRGWMLLFKELATAKAFST